MLPPRLDILARGGSWVAVLKPAGLATIPGRAETTSALERLAEQLNLPCTGSDDPRIRVVHRLDKDTSGGLLFALDTVTQRHLSHQFQNNTIEKEYLALVAGRPTESEGRIEAALAPHPTRRLEMAVSKQGRPALTLWKVEQRFKHHALLRVFPKTGKTHQIRVHLKHIGLPLAIDPLYNPAAGPLFLSRFKRGYQKSADRDERPLIARLTLHAEKLRFQSPDATLVEIIAPLPKDLRAAINQLSKAG